MVQFPELALFCNISPQSYVHRRLIDFLFAPMEINILVDGGIRVA